MQKFDLRGQRFGRLVPVERAGKRGSNITWLCRCDCGAKKVVASPELRTGKTKSCGCLRRENTGAMFRTHALGKPPEFNSWVNMKTRCLNPNSSDFHRYGARGIRVCDQWVDDFAAFYADMGPRPSPRHSLDRIDNGKGYSPDNCRWATAKEQANNRG